MEITLNRRAVPEHLQAQAESYILERLPKAIFRWESRDVPYCVTGITTGECGKISVYDTLPSPMTDASEYTAIALNEALLKMVREASRTQ